jgi:hypothetical protein
MRHSILSRLLSAARGTILVLCVTILSIVLPGSGSSYGDTANGKSQGESVQPSVVLSPIERKARLRELKGLAKDTIGWSLSHVGPIRSVRMDLLREAFKKTNERDIPLLLELLNQDLGDTTRQGVKYLIAMHGDVALAELDRVQRISEEQRWNVDYSDIRYMMESQLWNRL